jgi:hypothetical protein
LAESKTDKQALEKAIAEHLVRHGASDWGDVRVRFPDVSDSTFWRVVRKLKSNHQALAPEAKKVLKEVQRAKDHLPVSVAPATVLDRGVEAVSANLDYLAQINEALVAADKLRDYAMNAEGKVKIPAFLRDSARLRLDAVKSAAAVSTFLTDVRRMEAFFAAVVDEVGKVSPEAQHAIVERLHVLNREHGMTPAAFL